MKRILSCRKTLPPFWSANSAVIALLCAACFFLAISIRPNIAVAISQHGESSVATEPLKQQVDELIGQLNATRLSVRNDAERQLNKLDVQILPLLPKDPDVKSPGVRSALGRIRETLWQRKADLSVAASTVDVSKVKSVGELIEELRATGNRLEVSLPQQQQDLALNFPRHKRPLTFWESLSELHRQADLVAKVRTDSQSQQSLQLVESSNVKSNLPRQKSFLAGPFRILATPQRRQIIGEPNGQLLRMKFSLQTEPRLRPLFLIRHGKDLSLTGHANGKPDFAISPVSPNASVELPIGEQGIQIKFHQDFQSDRVPDHVTVQGEWKLQISGGREPFEFTADRSSVGARRRKAGVTIGVEQFERSIAKGKTSVSVVMSVNYRSSGRAFESHRNWLGRNDIVLKSSDGTENSANKMDVQLQAGGSAWVRYQFETSGRQSTQRIVYSVPTLITAVTIPVKFDRLKVTKQK